MLFTEEGDLSSFSYVGSTGGLENYCVTRNFLVHNYGLFIASLSTSGYSVIVGAELAVTVSLDGLRISANAVIPQYVPGQIYSSAFASRSIADGNHSVNICIAANTSSGHITSPWTAAYSFSVIR